MKCEKIKAGGFDQLILIPLYPQFSQATTGSSVNEWSRQAKSMVWISDTFCVLLSNHPKLSRRLLKISIDRDQIFPMSSGKYRLIFSAHGVSSQLHSKGIPISYKLEETVRSGGETWNMEISAHALFPKQGRPMQWLQTIPYENRREPCRPWP